MKLGIIMTRKKRQRQKKPKKTKKNRRWRHVRKLCCQCIFLQLMVNLQPFGSRILRTSFIKLTFSLSITFYLTKTEKRTYKFLTQLKKVGYDGKISDLEGKNSTISDYNNFTSDILAVKIKQKEIGNKSDISNLGNSYLK